MHYPSIPNWKFSYSLDWSDILLRSGYGSRCRVNSIVANYEEIASVDEIRIFFSNQWKCFDIFSNYHKAGPVCTPFKAHIDKYLWKKVRQHWVFCKLGKKWNVFCLILTLDECSAVSSLELLTLNSKPRSVW